MVSMTLARFSATALLCTLAACGDGGPGDGDELPAAFTVMATREAGVTDPCSTPMGADQDFTIVEADTDAPELRTTALPVLPCSFGSTDSGWLIECNNAAANPQTGDAHEPLVFAIDGDADGGRVTWKKYTSSAPTLPYCDDAFTIDGIVAVE
jgi:hypothetical protein